jgi:hypothetical protein
MKRIFYSFILIAGIISFSALISEEQNGAHGSQTGAPAAKTGSPGDNSNCTSCHSGSATTQAGLITSTIPSSGYVPGQTYTVTASISDPISVKFGFELSPQRVNGGLVGAMMLSDVGRTKFVFGTGNKYITHTTAGTSAPGHTATWSFQWTAPLAGTGSFTFYAAFNISNSNSASSGDRIVLSQLAVTEDISSGIETLADGSTISVYPNPATEKITVTINNQNRNTSAQLCNITGAVVKTIPALYSSPTEISISELPAGIYFLRLNSGKSVFTKRIVKL